MKNKVKVVLICVVVLLIAGVLPSLGSEIKTDAGASLKVNAPGLPGFMVGNEPLFKVEGKKHVPDASNKLQTVTKDDTIVDLINQIDESMILGYLEGLTSFGPRVTGEPGCEQAAEYIYNEFASMGLQVRYDDWETGGYISNNVEATLPGTDPTSDDIYIICGHYDTVPGVVGADDDGSGVAAVLAAAQVMSQATFSHMIRFVAFSGEEEGLFGSYMYVQDAINNEDNIVATLNADMIGYAISQEDGESMNIYEDDASQWLYDFTDSVSQQYFEYINLELIPTGFTWGSDHYYFWEYGYAALFYQEYNFNPYWHQVDDTIANMNMTYTAKGVKLMIATLGELAQLNSANSPPSKPSITGQNKIKPGVDYTYTFVSTDPETDDVYYIVDWGDGSDLVYVGPYASGEDVSLNHTWVEKGAYIIRAKAKDVYGAESAWGTLPITVPRAINNVILNRFFERFPNAFPIIRHLLGI